MGSEVAVKLDKRLQEAFHPTEFELTDNTHLHAGHRGNKDGLGHFAVRIRSASFNGKSRLERQRMVFAAVGEMMNTEIHALAMQCLSEDD